MKYYNSTHIKNEHDNISKPKAMQVGTKNLFDENIVLLTALQ